jgi:hypothetical protein
MWFVAKASSDVEEFILYTFDGEDCSFPFLRVLVPSLVVDFFDKNTVGRWWTEALTEWILEELKRKCPELKLNKDAIYFVNPYSLALISLEEKLKTKINLDLLPLVDLTK